MNKKTVWKILFFISFIPFVIPLVLGVYHTMIESWELLDWLILYSFIYYPTYIVGMVLMIISIFQYKKKE